VHLYVTTPTCEKYSRRNHKKSATRQHLTLGEVWDSLRYVREKRPRVVVVENVSEPEATGPMTGLLSRLEGYGLAGKR
jgi:site-specific DNA-cytosine methylase